MPVEVRPDTFSMVFFDAAEIRAIVERLVVEIGLPTDASVTIEVDESTPLGRAQVASIDPIVITAESGALENAKTVRLLDPVGTADVIGKLLLSVKDRLDPAFGDAPADDDLTLQESAAWEAYCVGRLGALGHPVQRQRRLYQFRNRHGFTDAADAAFDTLWAAQGLTWADIKGLSDGALAAQPA
jgi:hypothetical protein